LFKRNISCSLRSVADDNKLVAERQHFPLGLNIWYVIQVAGVNGDDDDDNNNNTLLKGRKDSRNMLLVLSEDIFNP
jgi:hypothetical protein